MLFIAMDRRKYKTFEKQYIYKEMLKIIMCNN